GGENPSHGSAQAENGPAGRGAFASAAAGRALSADLGADVGGAGHAAVAGASPQASADSDAHQEPVARAGAEPGSATQTQAVDGSGAGGVGEVGAVALCRDSAQEAAGNPGPSGNGDHGAEPASGGRSEATATSGEVDDASGRRSSDGVGHGADVRA